jgi:hypothetical protein
LEACWVGSAGAPGAFVHHRVPWRTLKPLVLETVCCTANFHSRNQDGLLSASSWFLSSLPAAIFNCNCRKDASLKPEIALSLDRRSGVMGVKRKSIDDANEQFRLRERLDFHWPILAMIGFVILDYLWLTKWS